MRLRVVTLLVLLSLAIGAWYLGAQAKRSRPANSAADENSVGYYLKDAVLTSYDESGALSMKLVADRIEQVGSGRQVQLFNVRMNYQPRPGQQWDMRGDQAQVDSTGKIVEMSGNVRLQETSDGRAGAAVISTDQMTYDANTTEVRTDREVHMDFGIHRLNSRGLVAHLNARKVKLESKVNGRFLP